MMWNGIALVLRRRVDRSRGTAYRQHRTRSPRLVGGAFLGLVLLALIGAESRAATISWGAPTNISGDSDVSTTGTLVGAFNPGGPGTTVNGVVFLQFPVGAPSNTVGDFTLSTPSGGSVGAGSYFSPDAPFATRSASYQILLAWAADASALTLTMNNLTIGQSYQLQLWRNESANWDPPGFTFDAVVDDTTGNVVNLDPNTSIIEGGLGQFVIGTFVADATSQQVIFDNEEIGGRLNGFQLRTASLGAATATPTVTLSSTVTRTSTPTGTSTVTSTITPSQTATTTITPTVTLSPTITQTQTTTVTPTITITPTVTSTPTMSATRTVTPTMTPTRTRTPTPTAICNPASPDARMIPGYCNSSEARDCDQELCSATAPALNSGGLPRPRVECNENDPLCDAVAGDDACTFSLSLCYNVADTRMPCVNSNSISRVLLRRPSQRVGGTAVDKTNRDAIVAALLAHGATVQGTCRNYPFFGSPCTLNSQCDSLLPGLGVCSITSITFAPPLTTPTCLGFQFKVPLRQAAGGGFVGAHKALRVRAYPTAGRHDGDILDLYCRP